MCPPVLDGAGIPGRESNHRGPFGDNLGLPWERGAREAVGGLMRVHKVEVVVSRYIHEYEKPGKRVSGTDNI